MILAIFKVMLSSVQMFRKGKKEGREMIGRPGHIRRKEERGKELGVLWN